MALGDGDSWDETVPTNATIATQIDEYDRDLRKGVRSRMSFEHEWPASQAATAEGGRHKFITLQNQSTEPTLTGTQVAAIYSKTVGTGLQELFFENELGSEVALTNRSSISVPTGGVVQIVNTQTGAVATGATAIPNDDTIPQNTEGTEFMTLAITPKSATNILLIEVTGYFGVAGANEVVAGALFQDTTAGALAASGGAIAPSANQMNCTVSLRHKMTAGTTSATTFKFRAGNLVGGGTVTFNGATGARIFGGVAASNITITEIQG